LAFVTSYFESKYFVTLLNWNRPLVYLFAFTAIITHQLRELVAELGGRACPPGEPLGAPMPGAISELSEPKSDILKIGTKPSVIYYKRRTSELSALRADKSNVLKNAANC
jgi:hypothetical protein